MLKILYFKNAARELGISYPTLKQWIYKKKIRASKTVGGHYRILRTEVERLSKSVTIAGKKPAGINAISGRNKLLDTIVEVKVEWLLAQIALNIGGHCRLLLNSSYFTLLDFEPKSSKINAFIPCTSWHRRVFLWHYVCLILNNSHVGT